jgi:hypothetical protein
MQEPIMLYGDAAVHAAEILIRRCMVQSPCERHQVEQPCWYCLRGIAICKSKIRISTWNEAEEWVKEYNESHAYLNPVVKYQCRWCNQYHMTRAKSATRNGKTMKKAKRKWLIAKEMTRREQLASPREDIS